MAKNNKNRNNQPNQPDMADETISSIKEVEEMSKATLDKEGKRHKLCDVKIEKAALKKAAIVGALAFTKTLYNELVK